MDPRFLRQEVPYGGGESAGTIIINTRDRMLYLVQGQGRAMRYGIGVGRPGFTLGASRHPKARMARLDSSGTKCSNAGRICRGIWTADPTIHSAHAPCTSDPTLYRIHGSNEPWTIGTQVSSGCIRMRNEDVIDLYGRVQIGTRVVVI